MLAIAEGKAVAYCEDPDCFREAERVSYDGRALCSMHRKRVQRTGSTQVVLRARRYETPLGRLFEASLELRDFPDDGQRDPEFTRAYDRWRKAAESFARTVSPAGPTLRRR